ncbi:MAG: radical SAM family heme chaperone HemW [Deltaproteobacteria bacterium]|nr:radical SAM family heme chaperone HemW [Deltaproteobacteria bacterium]
MVSLYLHIPFCKTKCCYCDFNSFASVGDLYKPYLVAIKKEIDETLSGEKGEPLDTLFIGGGTPTVLSPADLVDLISHVKGVVGFSPGIEISIEANPGTVSESDLALLREGGVNRISFGVQSFIDSELRLLGRCHDAGEAEKAVWAARSAGFGNISLDLMYGVPCQAPHLWQRSLDMAISLAPNHLSLYQLTVEQGTPLKGYIEIGRMVLPDEDEIAEMDLLTEQLCGAAGLNRYEISNYAETGSECAHNVNYWLNREYYAAGAGSVSYLQGVRMHRVADPVHYIDCISRDVSVIAGSEELSREAAFRETVVMGLRMVRGVSCRELHDRYGIDPEEYYGPILRRLTDLSLLQLSGGRLRITGEGRHLANTIMAELV